MIDEFRNHLKELEQKPEMPMLDQRMHLTILEEHKQYFEQSDWERYQKLSREYLERIKRLFPGMGS